MQDPSPEIRWAKPIRDGVHGPHNIRNSGRNVGRPVGEGDIEQRRTAIGGAKGAKQRRSEAALEKGEGAESVAFSPALQV